MTCSTSYQSGSSSVVLRKTPRKHRVIRYQLFITTVNKQEEGGAGEELSVLRLLALVSLCWWLSSRLLFCKSQISSVSTQQTNTFPPGRWVKTSQWVVTSQWRRSTSTLHLRSAGRWLHCCIWHAGSEIGLELNVFLCEMLIFGYFSLLRLNQRQ